MAEIFLYNLDNPKGRAIEAVCRSMRIACHHVATADYLERIGTVTHMPGFTRIGLPFTGTPFADEMMLLKGFEGKALDDFLAAYKAAGIAPVVLKASLTPTNVQWNTLQLYEELSRERRAFEEYRKQWTK